MKTNEGKEKLLSKVEEKSRKEGGCSDKKIIEAYENLTNKKEEMISENITRQSESKSNNSNYVKTNNYSDILNELNALASANYKNKTYNNSYSQFTIPNMFEMNMFNMYNPYNNIKGLEMIS